ncbi:MAG TPA: secretin N-terminal domain-containing protein [Gemmatimonadales bacterium]|nr:secretin N-terminal domain-containing protein [Gemmatimonadales bacterium]
MALMLLASATAPRLGAQEQPATVRINYVNANLADVIRSLAASLDVNVVLTDVPARRITFQTPQPVRLSEVGAVLEAILESEELVLVRAGPVAQVMPEAKRPATGPVQVGKEISSPPPLGLITQIVPLDFIRADEAVTLLQQIATRTARIEVVPRSNAVLITDRGVKIERYLELLRQLDVRTGGESGLRTYVYPLRHASASELAATLSELFGVTVPSTPERTRVKALEDRSLSSELETFRRREQEALEERRTTPIPVIPAPETAPTERRDTADRQGTGGGLVGQTTIVPDLATNSLVIRTAPPNFPVLQETIDRLDVRPAQVLLEVLIAEISLTRATQYGVNWRLFTRELVSDGGITGALGPAVPDTALGADGGLGLSVVSLGSVDVRAVLRALASRTNVRILSTPRVLALNNEEARILVGSQVPFTQSTRTGLDVVVDETVQYRNVGTQLTVVPTVNTDGYVTFRILQEVSALSAQTIEAALNAPVITTREAETSALVRSGRTIIIGGLIDETEQRIRSGVPVLQDLPIIGGIFRSESRGRSRTELAIFVTPRVVFDDEAADSLVRNQRAKFRNSRPTLDSLLAPTGDRPGLREADGEEALTNP